MRTAGFCPPLMLTKPSLIKRPVIEEGKQLLIGFDEGDYLKKLR